jgi:hypothetical protein
MAILLRASGVPTRNVTGFHGGERNPFAPYVAISQGDAHSWVEAHVGTEWRTYDPTPAAREAFAPATGVATRLRALFDLLEDRWMRWVVGYDLRDQVDAARRLWQWFRRWSSRDGVRSFDAEGDGEPRVVRRTDGSSGRVALVAGATILIAALVASVIAARRRGGEKQSARHRRARRILRAIDAALRRLERPRPIDHTPLEHLRAIDAPDDLRAAVALYGDVRFGGADVDAKHLRSVERALRRVRAIR